MHVDVAVIGAGIVGLACGAALARAGKTVVVLERHRRIAQETSSRNSEVIHAGLYYPHGSLKQATCVRGAELLYAWCASKNVPHARCGKIVVATHEDELEALDALALRAKENGANVELISAARVRELEPEVAAVAALESPNTGIVDSHAFAASLAAEIAAHDGHVALGREVVSVEVRGANNDGRVRLACDGAAGREDLDASLVVNAAGLYADEIAARFGVDLPQRFVKGTYFRCKRALVKRLVYPLPPRDGPSRTSAAESLGVHATVDLAGNVRLGPDTSPALTRHDYAVDESRRAEFFFAAAKYLPRLREDDLTVDMCGIRPKVAQRDVTDFVIERHGAAIHLVGIESPGLTAALAIAEHVVRLSS